MTITKVLSYHNNIIYNDNQNIQKLLIIYLIAITDISAHRF